MKVKKELHITANATEHNYNQVAVSMAGLNDLFNKFNVLETEEEVVGNLAQINGYVYALVNMDVLDEAEANEKIRPAAIDAAATQAMYIRNQSNGN